MPPTHHHRASSIRPAFWLAQAINAARRVYACGAARFGLGKKPDSTELYFDLEKFNLAISLIPQERFDSFLDRERPGETQQDREYRLQRRAMREENEALKQIWVSAGEDTETAIAKYQQYISEHPGSNLALISLGTAFKKAGRFEESLAVYRQSLGAKQRSRECSAILIHLSIGDVLTKMGRFDDAIAEYRKIIDSDRSHFLYGVMAERAYLHLGDVLKLKGKDREARAAWKQAIKSAQTKEIRAEATKRLKE